MAVIVVANPKGGVGKSTLATQISGWLASRGKRVTLGDLDRQQSSRQWLDIRPAHLARIEPWEISRDDIARPAKGATDAVIDTPAASSGQSSQTATSKAGLAPRTSSISSQYARQSPPSSSRAPSDSRPSKVLVVPARPRAAGS